MDGPPVPQQAQQDAARADGSAHTPEVEVAMPLPFRLPPVRYRTAAGAAGGAAGAGAAAAGGGGGAGAAAAGGGGGAGVDVPWAVDEPQVGVDALGLPWGLRRSHYGHREPTD